MTAIPKFTVAAEIANDIDSAFLDRQLLGSYLTSRGVPDAEIQNLHITLDPSLVHGPFIGSYYTPAPISKTGEHIIAFSDKLSRDYAEQGDHLRSMAEHFIYQTEHPNYLNRRRKFGLAMGSAGVLAGGVRGYEAADYLDGDMHKAVALPIEIASSLGGAAVLGTFMLFGAGHMVRTFGPSSRRAERAVRERITELPNCTLQVDFRITD